MTCLILSGGSGTRLWPISLPALPKPFVPLFRGGTLFAATIARNAGVCGTFALAIGKEHAGLALPAFAEAGIEVRPLVLEPLPRNTAPAAALAVLALDPEEIVLVSPADHLIRDEAAYRNAVDRAAALAREGFIVALGVKAGYPETGYGYIERDGDRVVRFTEKPSAAVAAEYCAGGKHLWNSGIFCFKAGVFLEELGKHSPETLKACRAAYASARGGARIEPRAEDMAIAPSISLDYAVMEKSDRMAVVACDMGWSDVGSYESLYALSAGGAAGNAAYAEKEPLFLDSSGCLVIERNGKKAVVLIDADDMMVVDTEDALLVARRGAGQRVKDAVRALSELEPLHRPEGDGRMPS